MRVRALTTLSVALLIAAPSPMLVAARGGATVSETASETAGSTAVRAAYVAVDRVMEAADLGLRSPHGITFARESGALLVTGTRSDGSAGLQTVSLLALLRGSVALPAGIPSTAGVAFDTTRDRLVAAPDATSLVAIPAAAGIVAPGAAGAESVLQGPGDGGAPAGVDVNAAGEVSILSADGAVRITRAATPSTASVNRVLSLAGAGEELSGLAVAPDGHLFSIGASGRALYEFDALGTLLATRDLAGLGLEAPQDITIAPSGDTSDAPTETSLYVADAGTASGTGAAVIELALDEPVLSPQVEAAAVSSVTHVDTIVTGAGSSWTPDSPDPSGLAYIAASETEVPSTRRDRLVSADGEVEESTGAGWNNVNVWFAPRDGATDTDVMNTTVSPTNPTNKEPVGAAYDPVRNELYLCKDGGSGRVWVYNAITMAQVRSFTITGAPYNNADAEGLAFGNGNLYMVDSLDNDLVKVQPGGNGIVGTGGDDVVSNYDLQQFGQTEPEGLDVHPDTGNIWVVSNRVSGGQPDPMIEVTPTGSLVSTVSIAAANPNSAAGVAVAPPSNGNPGYNIYIADRGVDNNDVPSENDGKIYEFSLGTPPPPLDTTITGGPSGSTTATDATFTFTGTGAASFECRLDSPTWSACTSPRNYPGPLALGSHTFDVRALDAGSNPDPTPATRTWTIVETLPPPTNLLLNPSFELDANSDGIPDDWGTNVKFTRSNATPAQDGAFVGRHLNNNSKTWQQVVVTAGTSYDFSGMVNLPATTDTFTFTLSIQWRAGRTNLAAPVIHTFTDDTAGTWQTRTATLVAPAGATSARVTMKGVSMNATGVAYVDAFSFSESP